MLDETRLEGIALLASQNAVNALIETQTILQLMVKKGLVAPEEVAITRGIVKSQPKYKHMLQALDSAIDRVDESAKFEELLQKSLQPNGNKNLTDEERNIQIGSCNIIKNSVISQNSGVVVIGNEVTINGVKMPPCPAKGHNSTIINNKVYLNGYELVNCKWKKTLRALWHKWF